MWELHIPRWCIFAAVGNVGVAVIETGKVRCWQQALPSPLVFSLNNGLIYRRCFSSKATQIVGAMSDYELQVVFRRLVEVVAAKTLDVILIFIRPDWVFSSTLVFSAAILIFRELRPCISTNHWSGLVSVDLGCASRMQRPSFFHVRWKLLDRLTEQ